MGPEIGVYCDRCKQYFIEDHFNPDWDDYGYTCPWCIAEMDYDAWDALT